MKWSARALLSLLGSVICVGVPGVAECAELYIAPPDDGEMSAMFHSPKDWEQTRKYVSGITRADHSLAQVSDAELTLWFQRMQEWHLNLELEVGAIKPWSIKGDEIFAAQVGQWRRLEHLGGHISSIVMDGPLAMTLSNLHGPEQYAVDEVVKFIALVREHYPGVRIGDIEPFPGLSVEEHARWLKDLQAALLQKGILGLDFYRLDVNWVVFATEAKAGWPDVQQIERICHNTKIPFSLIYWASGYPLYASRGLADNDTWSTLLMAQGYDYAAAGGKPDQYIVESWIGQPTKALPENDPSSFAGSVLQFARKFVK
jgi:hypothetical protein